MRTISPLSYRLKALSPSFDAPVVTELWSVTLLELEMQAEVDKFISTWLMAQNQDEREFANRLHGWLFDEVRFRPELSDDEHARYKTANDYAARFCYGLARRLGANFDKAFHELRRFYRLKQSDKISHIHTQSYGRI